MVGTKVRVRIAVVAEVVAIAASSLSQTGSIVAIEDSTNCSTTCLRTSLIVIEQVIAVAN